MRDALRPRRAHFPRTDEEVEGEVVKPAGNEQRIGLEQGADRLDAREATLGAGEERGDQAGIGDREQGGDRHAADAVDHDPPAGEEREPQPAEHGERVGDGEDEFEG
jgi:hypothetical protein